MSYERYNRGSQHQVHFAVKKAPEAAVCAHPNKCRAMLITTTVYGYVHVMYCPDCKKIQSLLLYGDQNWHLERPTQ